MSQQASHSAMFLKELISLADFNRQIPRGGESDEFFAIRGVEFLGDHQLRRRSGLERAAAGMNAHDGQSTAAHLIMQALHRVPAFLLLELDEFLQGRLQQRRMIELIGNLENRGRHT